MKPEQFIREFGVEKARHVLSGLPNYYTHMTDDARMFISEHNNDLDKNIRKQLPNLMRLDDLKRLVGSVDRVNEHGGYLAAKELLSFSIVHQEAFGKEALSDETINSLKGAIKDHESIYQPKCIHGFDVACLLCGFGTVDGERVYRNQGASHE